MLEGRTALVTGGASGIGRATCLALARAGASVVVADLDDAPRGGGIPTVEIIRRLGARAVFVGCDVTDARDRQTAISAAEELGELDLLVHNAGVFAMGPFLEVTPEDYDRMEAVNVRAAFFMAQAAARLMVTRRRGVIVNLSSTAGLVGTAGATTYCTTKFAIRGLTYALADELAPYGVRVNAVHPGLVETAMTTVDVEALGPERLSSIPLGRPASPEEVSSMIVMLASDAASFVTGASLAVDGGRTRS